LHLLIPLISTKPRFQIAESMNVSGSYYCLENSSAQIR